MLKILLVVITAVAGICGATIPPAFAQGDAIRTVADLRQVSERWQEERFETSDRMGQAQKVCDRTRYEIAKSNYLFAIHRQIALLDSLRRAINRGSSDERRRDQVLSIEILTELERLREIAAIFEAEQYVECDRKQAVAEHMRTCDAFGQGFFYIPGTDTCLKIRGEEVERRSVRTASAGASTCEALGLSGLTISSESDCLQIGGSVNYEFRWGGEPAADDGSLLSDVSVAVSPNFSFTAPVLRGFLAHEVSPGVLQNPAFEQELSYSGFDSGARFEAEFGLGSLGTGSFGAGVNFYSSTATAHEADISLNTLNIPSVGVTAGVFDGGPATVETFDFQSVRQGTAFDAQFGVPLAHGRAAIMPDYPFAWEADLVLGLRAGSSDTVETTRMVVDSTSFVPDIAIAYDTAFRAAFLGGSIGIGLSKRSALPDFGSGSEPLQLNSSLTATFGYDQHQISVTDSVEAGFIGSPPFHSSTNDIEYSLGVPTAKLAASIGIGTDTWNLFLNAALSLGADPYYNYHRPDSDAGGALEPELTLVPNAKYILGAGFSLGF